MGWIAQPRYREWAGVAVLGTAYMVAIAATLAHSDAPEERRVCACLRAPIEVVATFSLEGSDLVRRGRDGEVRRWRVSDIASSPPSHPGDFSPDRRSFFTRSSGGLKVWDTRTVELRATIEMYARAARWVGDTIVAANDSGVRVFDGTTGTLLREISIRMPEVFDLDVTSDRVMIASLEGDAARVWDLRTGALVFEVHGP